MELHIINHEGMKKEHHTNAKHGCLLGTERRGNRRNSRRYMKHELHLDEEGKAIE